MTQEVPASTKIRRKSLPNVETERLLRRLEWLREYVTRSHEWAGQKGEFKAVVVQCCVLERELERREVTYVPITNGAWREHHAYVPRKSLRGRIL